MKNYWKIVNDVLKEADVILLVGDARFPEESFNKEVYDKVKNRRKKFIFVLNKCDISKNKEIDMNVPYIFVSAQEHLGTLRLYKLIREVMKGEKAVVGVLGYPNTGKSSLINAMKGRKAAGTSSQAGYTRGLQKVRVSKDIILLDTPGVIPYKERDESKHARIASINPHQVRDPEEVLYDLMEKVPGVIEKHYGVKSNDDPEETLEKIAIKLAVLVKGGKPDAKRMAKMILQDWQKGRIFHS